MTRSPFESAEHRLKIDAIQLSLCERLEEMLDALGVEYSANARKFVGPCPVHGGDNTHAFSIFKTGHSVPGYWQCYTHNCSYVFNHSVIGFVRGVLSHTERGWTYSSSNELIVPFRRALDWCCDFLGQEYQDFRVDWEAIEKRKFVSTVESLTYSPAEESGGLTRDQIRERLHPPAQYFIERGWSEEVLDRFDVGTCLEKGKFFSDRAVAPIYDDSGSYAIGFTGRTICEKEPKWLNSNGFSKERHLYNYWNAKAHISDTQIACLCEGPGDVWRLEEAGIKNGVAMFGVILNDPQQVILEMSGALTIVLLTNMDDPGRQAAFRIKSQLERSFRVITPSLPMNDLGEMTPEQVRQTLEEVVS